MEKNDLITISIKDSSSIFIVKLFRTAHLYINSEMNKIKIRRPDSWSIILIPDEHRLFVGPLNPLFFQCDGDFFFGTRHTIIH